MTYAPSAVGDHTGTMAIAYGGEAPLTVAMTGLCVNEHELTVADGTRAPQLPASAAVIGQKTYGSNLIVSYCRKE